MDSQPPTPAPLVPVAAPGEAPAPTPTPPAIDIVNSGPYESNPFTVSIHGLIQILKVNPLAAIGVSIAIFAGFFGFGIVALIFLTLIKIPILAFLIIALGYIVLAPVIVGSNLHVASKSMRNQKTTIKEAIQVATGKILPLLGLGIVSALLISAGMVVLIIPGLIILARISLASIVMFEENLGIVDSLKRSVDLTKGHTFEMLGAVFAGSLLCTNGLLIFPTSVAPLVGRYQGLLTLGNAKGPKVHWLNYLAPAVVGTLVVMGIILNIVIGSYTKAVTPTYSPTIENSPYNSQTLPQTYSN